MKTLKYLHKHLNVTYFVVFATISICFFANAQPKVEKLKETPKSLVPDRIVVLTAKTFLNYEKDDTIKEITWSKVSGTGEVKIADTKTKKTTAEFSKLGRYVLNMKVIGSKRDTSINFNVEVISPNNKKRLDPISVSKYKINSAFWNERIKMQIVNWIPYCIEKLQDTTAGEGIQNFIEAGNKNNGRPYKLRKNKQSWADAYTINTVESMCLALQVDAQGDADILKAQKEIQAKLDEWIPIILAAQEPDGYLQTRFTLGYVYENKKPAPRFTRTNDCEGYVAGYFIEAAIAHFRLTEGKDRRMYNAAKKLADCWDTNIGPAPKKPWVSGHEVLEFALVSLARLVNEVEGPAKGNKYIQLSKFMLDIRGPGVIEKGRFSYDYEQSHIPLIQQYEAAGHAVRAVYCYTAMADIAMETGDAQYESAVKSLWDNLINKKYYITGGIGSGETPEGFGDNFSLRNGSYCEACASCGQIFFQHRMNLAEQDAKYADLMEETIYNALLGSVDLPAKNFTYTNPLDQKFNRYLWHICPCCAGNIPRTLLEIPTWMYSKNANSLFVNLYIGSTVKVGKIAGCDVEIEQRTDYPWKGNVEIVVNPSTSKTFSLQLRVPNRNVSTLYKATPEVSGISVISVNGTTVKPVMKDGYAIITREWKPSDKITFEIPLQVQRVKADDRVKADLNRVALRYGPLIYNIESVDQNLDATLDSKASLTADWDSKLLGGIIAIRGKFSNDSSFLAIPNYARMNRGGRSIVWINETKK